MKREDMTQEQKARQNRQNAASRQRYDSKAYDKAMFRCRSDGADGFTWDDVRAAAQRAGQSFNAWTIDAIRDKLRQQG